jgi:C-terminal processing protease CtpA/Prc
MEDALHISAPLFRRRPATYYWYQYMADSQTLYIQYNRCENDPKQSFREFARQALAEGDAHAFERVVIDLRLNGGGDSRIIGPLRDGLVSRLKKIGHVYVLIGPGTFSSAVMNAAELRGSLRAVLAGEPTGGKPGGYGDVKFLTLPNSKLIVQYTGALVGASKDAESNELVPDLAAPRTIADALAGRDPVLAAVIVAAR